MNIESSLLKSYFPVDYYDSFERSVSGKRAITPEELLHLIFSEFPWWVDMLMRVRNVLVKPFGLKNDGFEEHLSDMVQCRSERETIIGMNDKHLAFYVSLWCSSEEQDSQIVGVTTIVKYNNWLGRIYFFFIRPFHKLIIKNLLNNVSRLKL